MKLAFAGTPELALPVLQALRAAGHEIAAVITAPDRPAGRGRKLQTSAVKEEARQRGLPVHQPEDINEPAFFDLLRGLSPEALVVVAFGQKLRREVLALPRYGCFNVHPSLLPKYRGAAPVAWALWQGETETGVSVFRMDERLDAGDIVLQERVAIRPEETTGALAPQLSEVGARLMVAALDAIAAGTARFRGQNDAEATLARALRKEDGQVRWEHEASCVRNQVRAVTPWPGAFTFFHGQGAPPLRLILTRVCVVPAADAERAPGTVVRADDRTLLVASGGGVIEIDELKPAGKRLMSGAAFVRGHHVAAGDRFGLERNRGLTQASE